MLKLRHTFVSIVLQAVSQNQGNPNRNDKILGEIYERPGLQH
jgi:hypothetical protein